jgi:hypothetical protein
MILKVLSALNSKVDREEKIVATSFQLLLIISNDILNLFFFLLKIRVDKNEASYLLI